METSSWRSCWWRTTYSLNENSVFHLKDKNNRVWEFINAYLIVLKQLGKTLDSWSAKYRVPNSHDQSLIIDLNSINSTASVLGWSFLNVDHNYNSWFDLATSSTSTSSEKSWELSTSIPISSTSISTSITCSSQWTWIKTLFDSCCLGFCHVRCTLGTVQSDKRRMENTTNMLLITPIVEKIWKRVWTSQETTVDDVYWR